VERADLDTRAFQPFREPSPLLLVHRRQATHRGAPPTTWERGRPSTLACVYAERLARARARMSDLGVDVLLLSIGADLPYLTGYEAMPLERLTMLVVPTAGDAVLVVPRLEAPRVVERPDAFAIHAWDETDDPIALVTRLAGAPTTVAVGDHTWARFVLALQDALPGARFRPASDVTAPLRMVKDAGEIAALRAAAHAVDGIAAAIRDHAFAGRREIDVHRELVDRMIERGHQRANFAIVASGPNGASPHHEPGERVIVDGDVVLCDFGGTMDGYCSDITRVFVVGEPSTEVADAYAVLVDAQERAVRAATVGTPCGAVDAAARDAIAAAGLGDRFIHRTGHGIGVEAHEEPYIVAGNDRPLAAGHAFSIEPGIYVPGRFGLRLEDIVVATPNGPERLNNAARDLALVA
jgi:Xaa-Pro aminopeptidase